MRYVAIVPPMPKASQRAGLRFAWASYRYGEEPAHKDDQLHEFQKC